MARTPSTLIFCRGRTKQDDLNLALSQGLQYICRVFKVQSQSLTVISTLQEADGLVLIDIDHGSVTCSKSSDDNIDIPDVPLLLAQTFIQR